MKQSSFLFLFSLLLVNGPAQAGSWYVAVTGLDINSGSITEPFRTIPKAVSMMIAGDTVFVRGGVHPYSTTISLSKSGTAGARYFLFAYPGERPLLDFSAQTSSDAIKVNGSYWHLYGLDVKKSYHNGIAVNGHYNIIEHCATFENRNTGLQLGNGASYNTIRNCDSFFNYDPPSGGNADGFAPKLDVGTGNSFYGCRAWQNSDDGWDGYLRPAENVTTVIENCWSFMNGYLRDNSVIATGNGNGFKMGGGDTSNKDSLRHNVTLTRCLAFDNRVKGFDQNNNRGTMVLLHCTGYRNGAENYKVSAFIRASESLVVKNSLELGGKVNLAGFARQTTNSWTIPLAVTEADFASLDTTGIRGPRKPDGSLPDVPFLRLSAGSSAVNAGTDIGFAFNGPAPDLGAFEYTAPAGLPDQEMTAPQQFSLLQNYPNPFNPSTTIVYRIADDAVVRLAVYDLLGREIALLAEGFRSRGEYSVHLDARDLAGGIYLCRLSAGPHTSTRRMVMLK